MSIQHQLKYSLFFILMNYKGRWSIRLILNVQINSFYWPDMVHGLQTVTAGPQRIYHGDYTIMNLVYIYQALNDIFMLRISDVNSNLW